VDSNTKKSTRARGQWAEDRAAAYLESLGYIVLCRNFRCKGGELDLVALDGVHLCFVEVRFREGRLRGEPLETIDGRKRGRLVRAANQYLRKNPDIDTRRQFMRFDVVSVVGTDPANIQLVRDAFEAAEAW
jgi:putative endonuclease